MARRPMLPSAGVFEQEPRATWPHVQIGSVLIGSERHSSHRTLDAIEIAWVAIRALFESEHRVAGR